MTETLPDTLNFEDFRRAVGKSHYAVRLALAALHLKPETRGRHVYYRREWIEQVREQIERGAE